MTYIPRVPFFIRYKYLLVILVFSFLFCDTAFGFLTFVETHKHVANNVDGLNGARSVAVSPDNKHVYVAGYLDNAIAVFSRNTFSGALSSVETVVNGNNNVDGINGITSITVSPDGSHVYATGKSDNAVAVFSRDTTTGTLTFKQAIKDGDNEGEVDGLEEASSVTVSPDNKNVYITGTDSNGVAVFSRDIKEGTLTFKEKKAFGGTISGLVLDGASSVAVSPDNKHVYVTVVTTITVGFVTVFSRNIDDGTLTFIEDKIPGGIGDENVMLAPQSIFVSPDGAHAYVASADSDSVTVFTRETTAGNNFGKLTHVEIKTDGGDGGTIDGIDGVTSVAVSPNGEYVFAAGSADNAIAVFHRNATDGKLTWEEVTKENGSDAGGAIHGLVSAKAVTVSPDGLHIYAASKGSDGDGAVTVFDVGPMIRPPGLASGATYRLAFVSSDTKTGDSSDIDTYNSFVQNLAKDQAELKYLETTWKAIASTSSTNANANTDTKTSTTPQYPIYRVDGVKIADDYNDLWDGGIASPLKVYENGILWQSNDGYQNVYTGSNANGTGVAEHQMGAGEKVSIGLVSAPVGASTWITETSIISTQSARIYAISGVLPVVPSAPKIKTATAGDGKATVTFAPPVTNGGSTITRYKAVASPGDAWGEVVGNSSPITVTTIIVEGLTNGTSYTFTVTAENEAGISAASDASNSVYYTGGTEPSSSQEPSSSEPSTPSSSQPKSTYYLDGDGDGFGDPSASASDVSAPSGYVSDSSDCDDGDAGVYPGATEIVDDGIDQDCSGSDLITWYRDGDLDGYGNASATKISESDPSTAIQYVTNSQDCNDSNPYIYPGATEITGDGIDQDCDGTDIVTWYKDGDQDGFGDPSVSTASADKPLGYVSDKTDCNDADKNIHPGAAETAGDLIDQDCDGKDTPLLFIGTFEADPDSGLAPLTVDFTVLVAQGSPPYTFKYYFGDGTPAETGTNAISHTYEAKGSYTVKVKVTDATGASATMTADIEILDKNDLENLKSQLIIDADQAGQADQPEDLPGLLADAQIIIDKTLGAVSNADDKTKKEVQDAVREQAGDLIDNTKDKLSEFIAQDQVDQTDLDSILDGIQDVVSSMVKNDVAVAEDTLTALEDISGQIFSASVDTLLKGENLTQEQLEEIKTDPAKARAYFTANPHLLEAVVAATGIDIDIIENFSLNLIEQIGENQGLDGKQTADLFNAVKPTLDAEKAIALSKKTTKTIAEIAVEIVDAYYAGKTLAQFTIEPLTKNLLLEFTDNTYISFLIASAFIVDDFVPEGLFFTPDGGILGIKESYAIKFIPYPAFPFDFAAEILKLGMDPQLTPGGSLTAAFPNNTTLSTGMGWAAFPTNTLNALTTSFSVTGGSDPSAEAYSLLVSYETGLSQLIPPKVLAMDSLLEMLEETFPGNYFIDNNTGVITLAGLKLKPDYVFTDMDSIDFTVISAKGGLVYNTLAFELFDYNGDGIMDYNLYSKDPVGSQILYGLGN